MSEERPSWSEPLNPEEWSACGPLEFTEPIVAIVPHDDGARIILESGREYIVTPTR